MERTIRDFERRAGGWTSKGEYRFRTSTARQLKREITVAALSLIHTCSRIAE